MSGYSTYGFTTSTVGLHAVRRLKHEEAFLMGRDHPEIGAWAYENGYRIYMAYREVVTVDGVEHDFRYGPGIIMENEYHLIAFRMRWF